MTAKPTNSIYGQRRDEAKKQAEREAHPAVAAASATPRSSKSRDARHAPEIRPERGAIHTAKR